MSQHQASKDWFPVDGVVVFEEHPDRASALAAEAAAIRTEHPLHNVQHNSTVRIEASISAELHVSASGIFAMAAAGSGLLLAGQWLADVLAAWWTQMRAAQQGVTLQIPPARNPFIQDPPGPLLKFFWFSLAAMNACAEAETKTKTAGPNQAAMAFYMAMVKAQGTDATSRR